MLEVTVKTLDSRSRIFSVADDITVQGFKEHISGSVNIPVERQRLIFQGRVLQDNTQLHVHDISGKVIHLVERPLASTQPTPADLARERPRTQQPTNQGNAQAPRPTPTPVNILGLGPFPVPSGTPGNISVQLVQQMIQQALNGMSSSPAAPSSIRSTVVMSHPNAPGGDDRTEIQIHLTPQGASTQSRSTTANQRQQGSPAPQQGIRAQPRSTRQAQATRQSSPSVARCILNDVELLLRKLEKYVTDLETGNYDDTSHTQVNQGGEQPSARTEATAGSAPQPESSNASTEPMDVQPSEASHQTQTENNGSSADARQSGEAAASGMEDSTASNPSIIELGRAMRRLSELETRLLPFLSEYTDFLENDTPFTNTELDEIQFNDSGKMEPRWDSTHDLCLPLMLLSDDISINQAASPEFKRMKGFLTTVLKGQRALGVIHRDLSLVGIQLSGTPPRRMFMQNEGPINRVPPVRHIQNLVSAGHYLHPSPRFRQHRGPRGPIQG